MRILARQKLTWWSPKSELAGEGSECQWGLMVWGKSRGMQELEGPGTSAHRPAEEPGEEHGLPGFMHLDVQTWPCDLED